MGVSFIDEDIGVTTENDLPPEVIEKRYHIMLYGVHFTMNGTPTHNLGGDRHLLHSHR